MTSTCNQTGSVAVECALALPFLMVIVMMLVHLALLTIQQQSRIYDHYMTIREQVISADVARARAIPPGDNCVRDGGGQC